MYKQHRLAQAITNTSEHSPSKSNITMGRHQSNWKWARLQQQHQQQHRRRRRELSSGSIYLFVPLCSILARRLGFFFVFFPTFFLVNVAVVVVLCFVCARIAPIATIENALKYFFLIRCLCVSCIVANRNTWASLAARKKNRKNHPSLSRLVSMPSDVCCVSDWAVFPFTFSLSLQLFLSMRKLPW